MAVRVLLSVRCVRMRLRVQFGYCASGPSLARWRRQVGPDTLANTGEARLL